MTTSFISEAQVNEFDYVIVGGGTAGCVVASRLSEYLPKKKTLLIEAGPSDFNDDRILKLKEWLNLLGSELDYDYRTTEQPNGNSYIRHSRAKVLGGCSSHNTLISFRPFDLDCEIWESLGCYGWNFKMFSRVLNNLRNQIQPVHPRHRNQFCKDWINSCSAAFDIPIIEDFNKEIMEKGHLERGVGFFSVAYNPDDGRRSSASVAYLHPILRGEEKRPNLTILTDAWVSKINVTGDAVTGVNVTLRCGTRFTLTPRIETILCAGTIDTCRLMLLSGIGPKEQLLSFSIPVVLDLPGVGENLHDHPETIIIWELNTPMPPETTMHSDAGIFLRREIPNARGSDKEITDLMMHCYQIPFCLNTDRLGYETPTNAFCMTPNTPRPRSRGRIYLTSPDPNVKPALDFRYFTDPEGYDTATIVAGLKAARKVAKQAPFKDWVLKEVAPGPKVQTDAELSEYGRRAAHTVYHPAGTTKMGDPNKDPMVVVDCKLKVIGLKKLRIADAAIGERAAELIAADAGWAR